MPLNPDLSLPVTACGGCSYTSLSTLKDVTLRCPLGGTLKTDREKLPGSNDTQLQVITNGYDGPVKLQQLSSVVGHMAFKHSCHAWHGGTAVSATASRHQ